MIKCNNSKKRNSQNKTILMAIIGQGLKSVLRYHEERWITYAEQALSLLNHEVMWQGIVEACKILKYPEPSAMHRDYFETLFDMSCFICGRSTKVVFLVTLLFTDICALLQNTPQVFIIRL